MGRFLTLCDTMRRNGTLLENYVCSTSERYILNYVPTLSGRSSDVIQEIFLFFKRFWPIHMIFGLLLTDCRALSNSKGPNSPQSFSESAFQDESNATGISFLSHREVLGLACSFLKHYQQHCIGGCLSYPLPVNQGPVNRGPTLGRIFTPVVRLTDYVPNHYVWNTSGVRPNYV
eukprot:sb/3472032/